MIRTHHIVPNPLVKYFKHYQMFIREFTMDLVRNYILRTIATCNLFCKCYFGIVISITQRIGEPVLGGENGTTGVLADHSLLNKYYAFGIRNGFGLAFDPVTNKLWDSENGAGYGDEINLVEPGFNSGWLRVQGWWPVTTSNPLPAARGYFDDNMVTIPANLETFADKGRYRSPEFAWNMSIGVTALEFLRGDTLGRRVSK